MSDEDIDRFYEELDAVMKINKSHDTTMVTRDLNANVGSKRNDNIAGSHGLGTKNDREID